MDYISLSDIASYKQGKQIPVDKQSSTCEDGMVRFVRIVDFTNPSEPPRYIENPGTQYAVDKKDIVMIRYGSQTAGTVVRGIPGIIANNMFQIHINDSRFDTNYMYYYLTSSAVKQMLMGGQSSSTMPAITFGMLKQVQVPVRPLEDQKKIANFLGEIDKKIEINKRINDNLQQQAQAVYQNWFVEYAPFGGVAPLDWNAGRLKDILKLHKRSTKPGADPNLPYLPIDMIPMRTFSVIDFRPNKEAQSSLIKFRKDDIVIGAMRVYFHRVIPAPCDGITRTTCFILKPVDPSYLSYALLTCDLDSSIAHAQKTSKGSTMPYAVWDGGMGEIELEIPSEAVAKEFNEIILPLLRLIQQNCSEIRSLQAIRDALLPKLMSGEIDVSDIQL